MILFGFRGKRKRLGTVFTECPQCHRACSQVVARTQRWFTLFFIPIFPFSTTFLTVCSMCSGATKIDRARAEHLSKMGEQQAGPPPSTGPDPTPSVLPTSDGDTGHRRFPPCTAARRRATSHESSGEGSQRASARTTDQACCACLVVTSSPHRRAIAPGRGA